MVLKRILSAIFLRKKPELPIDPVTVIQGGMHVTEAWMEDMLSSWGMSGNLEGGVSYADLQAGQTVTFLFDVQEEGEAESHLERVTVCLDVLERGYADYIEAIKDAASPEDLKRWVPPEGAPTNWLFECTVLQTTTELDEDRGFGSILPHGGVDFVSLNPIHTIRNERYRRAGHHLPSRYPTIE